MPGGHSHSSHSAASHSHASHFGHSSIGHSSIGHSPIHHSPFHSSIGHSTIGHFHSSHHCPPPVPAENEVHILWDHSTNRFPSVYTAKLNGRMTPQELDGVVNTLNQAAEPPKPSTDSPAPVKRISVLCLRSLFMCIDCFAVHQCVSFCSLS